MERRPQSLIADRSKGKMRIATGIGGVFALCVALSSPFCNAQNSSSEYGVDKTKLFFSYITTVTSSGGFVAAGAIPVVDWALEQINNNTEVLSNYILNYTTIHNSKVNLPACGYACIQTYTHICIQSSKSVVLDNL